MMGDIADMILDGSLCQECGSVIGDGNGDGYPTTCSGCSGEPIERARKPNKSKQKMKRYPCKICGKHFAVMAQHMHHKHGIDQSGERIKP